MAVKEKRYVEYPSSDGEPMAETDLHRDWMLRLIQRVKRRYRGKRVYVSGNLLIYYREGKPQFCFAPDLFVVKDVEQGNRNVYLVWEEGKVPDFCLETTSKKTRLDDQRYKMQLYSELGIKEYFLFDPTADWLDPPLVGYTLIDEAYVPIEPNAQGKLLSKELGLFFYLEEGELVMEDAAAGVRLLDEEEGRDLAEEQLDEERLIAQQERRKADDARRRADEEHHRAEQAEALLAKELAARKALEEELERLRQELDRKPNGKK